MAMGWLCQLASGRLPQAYMWTPVVLLLLSTTASIWQRDVLAEQYGLAPDVDAFLGELKALRNCAAPKGKMRVVCRGRNATFLQPPGMMDDWDIFRQNFCYCDAECHLFHDCCADVADLKPSASRRDLVKGIPVEQWSCAPLKIERSARKVPQSIRMVSSCPGNFSRPRTKCVSPTSSAASGAAAHLLDVPAMDRETGVWYSNVFCAHCHGVVARLAPMRHKLVCSDVSKEDEQSYREEIAAGNATYEPGALRWTLDDGGKCELQVTPERWNERRPGVVEPVPGFYRPCVTAVDSCASTNADAVAAARCPAFAYYVMTGMDMVYKNPYCAACNGVSAKQLLCWNPGDGIFRVSNRFSPPALSILMDYRWDPAWRTGKIVNAPIEVIFNPLEGTCVSLTNSSVEYIPQDGHCVQPPTADNATECHRLTLRTGDYKFLANKSLLIHYNVRYNDYEIDADRYDISPEGQVVVCATLNLIGEGLIFSQRAQSIVTAICLTISTVCLCMHIITYSSIPKLSNLPGRNLLSLSWSLLLGQLIFLVGVHPVFDVHRGFCIAVAVAIHYFYLAAFAWMSVMSYDIWRKFTSPTPESGHVGLHRKYSAYAWGAPASVVAAAVAVDLAHVIPPYARPNYGHRDNCWFGSPLGLGIFFAAPVIAILVVNTALFATTVRKIMQQKRESTNYIRNQVRAELLEAKARNSSMHGQASSTTRHPASGARDTVRLYLYVKLFTIMGLTWVIGFVAAFANVAALWFPFIVLNGLQGAFIFVMFDCKRSIGNSMWAKTLGRRYPTPGFLRTPQRPGESRSDVGSSTATTSLRTASSRGGGGRRSSNGEGSDQRQKVRVCMSNIAYQEGDIDNEPACEDVTKFDNTVHG